MTEQIVLSEEDVTRLKALAEGLGIDVVSGREYGVRPVAGRPGQLTRVLLSGSDTWFVELMERMFQALFPSLKEPRGEYAHDDVDPVINTMSPVCRCFTDRTEKQEGRGE